jgi:hypothetical protein
MRNGSHSRHSYPAHKMLPRATFRRQCELWQRMLDIADSGGRPLDDYFRKLLIKQANPKWTSRSTTAQRRALKRLHTKKARVYMREEE